MALDGFSQRQWPINKIVTVEADREG